jgi:hypothetical protein
MVRFDRPKDSAEIEDAKLDDARIGQRRADSRISMGSRLFRLRLEPLFECATLLARKPNGIIRPVGKEAQGDDAEQHGGNTLDNEQPPPSCKAGMTI